MNMKNIKVKRRRGASVLLFLDGVFFFPIVEVGVLPVQETVYSRCHLQLQDPNK